MCGALYEIEGSWRVYKLRMAIKHHLFYKFAFSADSALVPDKFGTCHRVSCVILGVLLPS